LHIWALSTTETALTSHIVISDMSRMEEIKAHLKKILSEEGVSHATLEFEGKNICCLNNCF